MQSLSQKHSKAIFFAPQNHLCDGSLCRAIDAQEHPLYWDDDHLSIRGAYFLEPFIDEAIAQLVRNTRPYVILRSRHDPKIPGFDDAKVIGD